MAAPPQKKRRRGKNNKPTLIKEYELLRDFSICRFETIVIDVDSPFDLVYPVWKEFRGLGNYPNF